MSLQAALIDRAEPPLRPIRPNVPLNLVLGAVVGLVLGLAVWGSLWLMGAAHQGREASAPTGARASGIACLRWPARILGTLWGLLFLVFVIAKHSQISLWRSRWNSLPWA